MNFYTLPWTTIYCVELSFLGMMNYSELFIYRPDIYSLYMSPGPGMTRVYKNERFNLAVI